MKQANRSDYHAVISVGYLIALTLAAIVSTALVAVATIGRIRRATMNARLLLRLYLEVAAFTGALFLVFELIGPMQWLLASIFGLDAIYGSPPVFQTPPPSRQCAPPNAPICQPADVQLQLWLADRERLNVANLTRGAIFAGLTAVFSAGHFALRFVVLRDEERAGLLHRAHLIVGLLAFGAITALYLPAPLGDLIDHLSFPDTYAARSGVGLALPFGLASLLAWLVYATLLVLDLRPAPTPRPDPDAIPVWR